jgi:hypothetical protein
MKRHIKAYHDRIRVLESYTIGLHNKYKSEIEELKKT